MAMATAVPEAVVAPPGAADDGGVVVVTPESAFPSLQEQERKAATAAAEAAAGDDGVPRLAALDLGAATEAMLAASADAESSSIVGMTPAGGAEAAADHAPVEGSSSLDIKPGAAAAAVGAAIKQAKAELEMMQALQEGGQLPLPPADRGTAGEAAYADAANDAVVRRAFCHAACREWKD